MNEFEEHIRKNIIKLRKQNLLTQVQMAESLGISQNSYQKFESGETRIRIDHLEDFSKILKVSIRNLLNIDEYKNDGRNLIINDLKQEIKKLKEMNEELTQALLNQLKKNDE